ncbi:hypothetical protein niasHS_010743 [Heterodera schachtii]|uniref:Uncharacterized protein n=1 Tax=Heterodera schachtii TaxID=97005 RepID=A0ABD2IUE6_HETSC
MRRRNLFKLFFNKYLFLFAAFLASDYVLYSKLSKFLLDENLDLEELNAKTFHRVTIDQLIANVSRSTPLDLLTKIPSRNDIDPEEKSAFAYQKAMCNSLTRIRGDRNNFQICYPPKRNLTGQLAYFINGKRDIPFERNFKTMLNQGTKLKVFTKKNQWTTEDGQWEEGADVVEDVNVKIYTEEEEDEHGQSQTGIKDLIDSQDDYHLMEFLKFEMSNLTDPIVFSINIPVFASHMLIRLDHFSYNEFRYLIKRLAYALYFPYSIESDRKLRVHFVSLMHKYSMDRYNVIGLKETKWAEKAMSE